jgi:GT2 family glycosyltransferase
VDLSIVIVSWNVREDLLKCLGMIYEHRPACTFDVWVVDNASHDGSLEAVKQAFPEVVLIENSENVGFAAANNQAIARSRGRFVLMLNPDTLPQPGALDALVDFLQAHPQAGAAGSRLLNPDGSPQDSCFPFPTLAREFWRLFHLDRFRAYGVYDMRAWDTERPRPVEVLQGTSLLLRREALDETGLLDEGYFVYTEEVDLCYRLHQAGWELHWVPRSRVVHFGGQSTRQANRAMFVSLYRTKTQYFRKHHGRGSALAYRLILLLAALFRLALTPLTWLEPSNRRAEHLKAAGNYGELLRVISKI